MSDTKVYSGTAGTPCLQGVGCGVTGCKYHTKSGRCCAEHIMVQNDNAQRKAETFCSTFEPGHTMQ